MSPPSRGFERNYNFLFLTAIPIKYDGMDAKKAVQFASLLSELVHLTEKFVESEPELENSRTAVTSNAEAPTQQLVTLRLRTLKHELIVAPGLFTISEDLYPLFS